MKIPWVPVTTGGGVMGPVEPTKSFLESYSTATNPVSHKAFQNLPLETAAPAVEIHSVNKANKKALQSTKIRLENDGLVGGAGEGYVDSFITKPIQGNYQGILLDLERQRIDTQQSMKDANAMATLAEVAQAGYRNLGENADEQRLNSLRDRLRFAGASNEEIEEILKQQKKENLLAKIKVPLSNEQKQVMMAEEMYRTMIKSKTEEVLSPAYRPPADTNVYNFPMPGAAAYSSVNEYTEPGNEIFAGRANAGVNPAGPGGAAASSRAFASAVDYSRYLRRAVRKTEEPILEIPARPVTDLVPVPVIGKAPNILAGIEVGRPRPFPLLRPVGLQQPRLVMTPLGEKVLRQRVAPSVPMMIEDIKPEAKPAEMPAQFGPVQRRRGERGPDTMPRFRMSSNVEKFLGISAEAQRAMSAEEYEKAKKEAKKISRRKK